MKQNLLTLCLLFGACTGLPQAMKDVHVVDVTLHSGIQSMEAHNGSSVR